MEEKSAKAEAALKAYHAQKECTFCHVDDSVTWEIGSKISQRTNLIIADLRWKRKPPSWLDYLVLPYIYRQFYNHAVFIDTHSSLATLKRSFVVVPLNVQEENQRRTKRSYYTTFQTVRPYAERFFEWLCSPKPS
jgi:hypothetical protein